MKVKIVQNPSVAPQCDECATWSQMYLLMSNTDAWHYRCPINMQHEVVLRREPEPRAKMNLPAVGSRVKIKCKTCHTDGSQYALNIYKDPFAYETQCNFCGEKNNYSPFELMAIPGVLDPIAPAATKSYPQHCGKDMNIVGLAATTGEPIYQCDTCGVAGMEKSSNPDACPKSRLGPGGDHTYILGKYECQDCGQKHPGQGLLQTGNTGQVVNGSNLRFGPIPKPDFNFRKPWPGADQGRYPDPEELRDWLMRLKPSELINALQDMIDDRAALRDVFLDVYEKEVDPWHGDSLQS